MNPENIVHGLRKLADDIEDGVLNPGTVLVCWDDPETMVSGACFGKLPDRAGIAGLFAEASAKAATGAWK